MCDIAEQRRTFVCLLCEILRAKEHLLFYILEMFFFLKFYQLANQCDLSNYKRNDREIKTYLISKFDTSSEIKYFERKQENTQQSSVYTIFHRHSKCSNN